MKFPETLFWKVVCLVLVVACLRVRPVGFVVVGVMTYYAMLSVPLPRSRTTASSKTSSSSSSSREEAVSARVSTAPPDATTPREEEDVSEKTPNWRKATTGPAATHEKTSPVRQPTPDNWARLRKALYDEMSSGSRGRR